MLKKVPHTYVIIFYLILLAAVVTLILPGGQYVESTVCENSVIKKSMVFQPVDHQIQTWQVFGALFKGFTRQSGIIVFILMIGGAFWILNNSRAIDVGIFSFLRLTKKLEHKKFFRALGVDNIIMTLIMLLFSAFGAIFGMSEETIAFIIILVPLAISMGYDSITGVALVFVAAGLGFAGAVLNPFTIGIAQGLSDIPLFSGLEYRFVCWLVINVVGITYILRYAQKIKKNPQKSIVYTEDEYWRKKSAGDEEKIQYHTPISAWVVFGLILAVLVTASVLYPQTRIKIGEPDSVDIMAATNSSGIARTSLKGTGIKDTVNLFVECEPVGVSREAKKFLASGILCGDSIVFTISTLDKDSIISKRTERATNDKIQISIVKGTKTVSTGSIGMSDMLIADSVLIRLQIGDKSLNTGQAEVPLLLKLAADDSVDIAVWSKNSGSGTAKTIPVLPVITFLFAIIGVLSLRKSSHFFVLLLLILTMIVLIVGVMGYGWYIMEIATLFFAMGIASGIAMNKSPDNIVKLFLEGVKDIMSAAIIVGLAGGIIVILEDGKVIDTILHGLSAYMKGFGKMATVGIMYAIQTVINIVIPSGSAKAALTMPIMAPFSDLVNLSRQSTVMAFQFGDGFTNMITPTSGVLIAVLGVAKIPYEKWVKWITPLMIILMILGFLLLIPTVTMELSGF